MSNVKASVIIPTHNRQDKLVETIACLKRQQLEETEYEIIVVDDGSNPAVVVGESQEGPMIRLERTEGVERSAARNYGALIARGDLLIFVDDDISVEPDFVAAHLRAHAEWPGALVVGSVNLPEEAMVKPFARFRQRLERQGLPHSRGPTGIRNFCTAANMSISRDLLQVLGGFDVSIASGEDQDLALRHTGRGGRIVFLRDAIAVHRDDALDIQSYCRRAEWGSLHMLDFCRRYPDLPDNVERERINGPSMLGQEPLRQSLRKQIKLGLTLKPVIGALIGVAWLLERIGPNSRVLDRVYRFLLGAHILRGYRKGLRHSTISRDEPAVCVQQKTGNSKLTSDPLQSDH